MSKRFTDTHIWDDGWHQGLPLKYKLFWKYLCDKCDLAGAWKVNMALAEFQIGDKLNEDDALRIFNAGKDRVKKYDGVWLLVEFVSFQYGKLHPGKVRFHTTIQEQIDRLSHRLSGRVSDTLQEEEEDGDKEKVKEGVGDIQGGAGGWTLDDCRAAAGTIAMPDSMIVDFYNNYAAVGWIDVPGRKITNLAAALAKWKANQSSRGKQTTAPSEKPMTVWEMTQKRDAMKEAWKREINKPDGQRDKAAVKRLRDGWESMDLKIAETGQ